MAGLGRKTFTAGDVLTASQVQGYLQDQTVMVFAGTAARSSAIATPSDGMFTVTTNDDQVDYYNGTAWVSALPIGAWKTWAPTLSDGFASISGTHTAKYAQIGKTVIATDTFVLSGASGIGTNLTVSLPVVAAGLVNIVGNAYCGLTSTTGFSPLGLFSTSTSTVRMFASNASGTYVLYQSVTATAPLTWAIGSIFSFTVVYEAA